MRKCDHCHTRSLAERVCVWQERAALCWAGVSGREWAGWGDTSSERSVIEGAARSAVDALWLGGHCPYIRRSHRGRILSEWVRVE